MLSCAGSSSRTAHSRRLVAINATAFVNLRESPALGVWQWLFAVLPPTQRLALELQGYAALPNTAAKTNQNTNAQLAQHQGLNLHRGGRQGSREPRITRRAK
jgi:hypothetical protein